MCIYVCTLCNFVSYLCILSILCIFVFLCDILLPSGVINDDRHQPHHHPIRIFGWMDSYAVLAAALVFIPSLWSLLMTSV